MKTQAIKPAMRHILGVEVYRDENNIEWVALPNGDLVINKPLR